MRCGAQQLSRRSRQRRVAAALCCAWQLLRGAQAGQLQPL
jgi:hypothetical protein